ncbi:MAG: B12-binding domain-containing radical SAM protein [Proteobacteria bacterium]|nr:radical SAM protein [Desulfobacteraceae bacterium]MBU3981574.1 B12-binding domain-containing radical SAM protein [Pseudomonadota bacterium]MBU4014568.1 B12-binding domain-containing radical SAM protein [Pseudomonadota bacterium]MBU4068854.1 B12-binding domain-containing radical SAM protein [Pseudomonadota bacterium]MBU4128364.1 B12-binding domain-containing radical SAM protein [Pseudomonadota bacterium]
MSLKVLLITPPYHCGVLESAGSWLPTAFVYLAGSLRKAGYEVEIYDAMSKFHTYEDIRAHLTEVQPDVIATGAITATIYDCLNVLKLAKELNPETLTILGNVHPTFCWEEILKEHHDIVDYIVRGEGEQTLVALLNCISDSRDPAGIEGLAFWRNGKPVVTPDRPLVQDLDLLATAWDLIQWDEYTYHTKPGSTLAVVSSSRGCTQNCSFCSQRLFWKQTWRARSPENFVAELEYLHREFGVDVAMISDETPTVDRHRWEHILDLLIHKRLDLELLMETRVNDVLRDKDILGKYRKAGIVHIYVGVEATSQKTLDQFKKGTRVEESKKAIELINAMDIVSETSFVIGMPDDTMESIARTVELAKYYDPDMAFFLPISPWPYADLYPQLKPHIEVFDYSKYNLVEPVVKPINMTLDELRKAIGKASMDFYTDKLSRLDKMSPYKRKFMIAVIDIIANNSYLAEMMGSLGENADGMPLDIKKYLDSIS